MASLPSSAPQSDPDHLKPIAPTDLAALHATIVGDGRLSDFLRNRPTVTPAAAVAVLNRLLAADKDQANLQFLYDKRLTLFNTRRDHEWKIYFAAWVLLGALDAALLASTIPTQAPFFPIIWGGLCLGIFLATTGYEADLQRRNTTDREAMDRLQNVLCDGLGLASDDPIRERRRMGLRRPLGWAFFWQATALFLGSALSALLPILRAS